MRKKLLFGFLTLLLVLGLAEFLALAAFGLKTGKFFPYGTYAEMMQTVAVPPQEQRELGVVRGGLEVMHPYLGYVYNPASHQTVSKSGFQNLGASIVPSKDEATLNVAVLGGSFAAHVALLTGDELAAALAPLGRRIQIVNLALGGYKQPQQLMALSYALSLDAHYDIVINIDGFNEVALPWADNLQSGVFPLYPRQWHLRVAGLKDPIIVRLASKLLDLRERRRALAETAWRLRLYRSALTSWTWHAVELRFQRLIDEKIAELNVSRVEGEYSFQVTGPTYSFPGTERFYTYLAEHWARSSRLIHNQCRANGARYYHFLQPNQYIEGSKPMGPEEKAIAIKEDHSYRPGVVAGYSHLQRAGKRLAGRVHFHDLTMILADREEALYRDDCCHLTKAGYRILAAEIGRTIVEDFSRRPEAGRTESTR